MRAEARLLLAVATLALASVLACAVDDRVLHGGNEGGRTARGGASSGGSGGTGARESSGGGGTSGGSGGTPNLGSGGGSEVTAGGGGSGGGPGADCPDLDRNLVPDCEETLLENPDFDLSTDGWTAEPDAKVAWNAMDAQAAPDSGSMIVENTQTGDTDTLGMVGASHCVSVKAGERYSLYAETFIQADTPSGYGAATVWFYDQPDCSGTLVQAAQSPLQGAVMTWKVIRIRPIVVPDFTTSMLVRLTAAKTLMAAPLTVRFDNVLLSR